MKFNNQDNFLKRKHSTEVADEQNSNKRQKNLENGVEQAVEEKEQPIQFKTKKNTKTNFNLRYNQKDENGNTALHEKIAAKYELSKISSFIKNKPQLLEVSNNKGQKPLDLAIDILVDEFTDYNAKLLSLLLQHDADLNLENFCRLANFVQPEEEIHWSPLAIISKVGPKTLKKIASNRFIDELVDEKDFFSLSLLIDLMEKKEIEVPISLFLKHWDLEMEQYKYRVEGPKIPEDSNKLMKKGEYSINSEFFKHHKELMFMTEFKNFGKDSGMLEEEIKNVIKASVKFKLFEKLEELKYRHEIENSRNELKALDVEMKKEIKNSINFFVVREAKSDTDNHSRIRETQDFSSLQNSFTVFPQQKVSTPTALKSNTRNKVVDSSFGSVKAPTISRRSKKWIAIAKDAKKAKK